MTDCPNGEMRDLLPGLLHERLAPAERTRVEAHVSTCDDCRAELALLGELSGTLRRRPQVNTGAIVQALPRYAAPARHSWVGWRAAAAIAAITVGGISVAVARQQGAPSPLPATVAARSASPVIAAPQAPVQTPTANVDSSNPVPQRVAQAPARHELGVSGAVSDLSDGELASLLNGIESLDAVPAASVDVESNSLAPLPVAPARGTT